MPQPKRLGRVATLSSSQHDVVAAASTIGHDETKMLVELKLYDAAEVNPLKTAVFERRSPFLFVDLSTVHSRQMIS